MAPVKKKGTKSPKRAPPTAQPQMRAAVKPKGFAQAAPAAASLAFEATPPRSVKPPPGHHRHPGACRFQGKEYVGELISGGTTFTVSSKRLNPADADMFPLLSNLAVAFNYYSFADLELTVVPTTNTTETGRSMLHVEPDIFKGAPSSKSELVNGSNSISVTPWQTGGWLKVERSVLHAREWYFCQATGGITADEDQRLADVARLDLATWGQDAGSANKSIGEIWVKYTVDFHTFTSSPASLSPVIMMTDTTLTESPTGAFHPSLSGTSLTGTTMTDALPIPTGSVLGTDYAISPVTDKWEEFWVEIDAFGTAITDLGWALVSSPGAIVSTGSGWVWSNYTKVINAAGTVAKVTGSLRANAKEVGTILSTSAYLATALATTLTQLSLKLFRTESSTAEPGVFLARDLLRKKYPRHPIFQMEEIPPALLPPDDEVESIRATITSLMDRLDGLSRPTLGAPR